MSTEPMPHTAICGNDQFDCGWISFSGQDIEGGRCVRGFETKLELRLVWRLVVGWRRGNKRRLI